MNSAPLCHLSYGGSSGAGVRRLWTRASRPPHRRAAPTVRGRKRCNGRRVAWTSDVTVCSWVAPPAGLEPAPPVLETGPLPLRYDGTWGGGNERGPASRCEAAAGPGRDVSRISSLLPHTRDCRRARMRIAQRRTALRRSWRSSVIPWSSARTPVRARRQVTHRHAHTSVAGAFQRTSMGSSRADSFRPSAVTQLTCT